RRLSCCISDVIKDTSLFFCAHTERNTSGCKAECVQVARPLAANPLRFFRKVASQLRFAAVSRKESVKRGYAG
ncbi:hypothetical protein, partial [Kalamiella sp. sgz302252]|uniref:hypothetical protein n=1 Tax=Pantoea sp. sgz302252 TaxID=3341827 RepID=UPI0036D3F52C